MRRNVAQFPSPHHVANAAPRWVTALYALGVIPTLGFAGVMLAGVGQGGRGFSTLLAALALAGGAVAAVSLQVSALAGLLAHRHWAREVALMVQAVWVVAGAALLVAAVNRGSSGPALLGVPILVLAFLATRTLLRGWDLGPAPEYEDAIHPHGWVTWASAVGAALLLPWLAFSVWLAGYLHSLTPQIDLAESAYLCFLLTAIVLPWFMVHAFAFYGLSRRHDYGLVVAIIGGVLWFFTIVGIPIGIAQLYSVWKVGHPVLALNGRLPGPAATPV